MKDFYLGIDLGTTNSVIGYGNITKNNVLHCNIIDLERKTENGGMARGKILPSVVFYYKDMNTGQLKPEVGDYAKGRYGTKVGYVSKSVKSLMGVTESANLAEEIEDQTPSQVSAQILNFMLRKAKRKLLENSLEDVIITVPASFDSDQCQATIDAAKLAGINVENEHDILLYEPKAVIYDFVNMMEEGEIPSGVIDLETPKNILVFDLGGGTLDVTIHKVGYQENGMMSIEDLAISRFTKIGGDDFDELIAKEMYQRFLRQSGAYIPEKRKEEVMCKLRKLAEHLKVEMSNNATSYHDMEKEFPLNYYVDVYDMTIFDSYSYSDEFTNEELQQCIEPLMGYGLKKEDVKRIDSMKKTEMDNIIYPILDVLAKAGENCTIDAVILNGGMTRFYPIKKRIDDFFGLKSLITSDPDLSVARGAVYYHYCLHKYGVGRTDSFDEKEENRFDQSGFQVGTILNDSLNIGVGGQYVSRLVEAGTKLPYESKIIQDKYTFEKYSDTIAIEIFLGRGKTKDIPNRRIADRIVKFSKKYPKGTPVSFKICIDNMRRMRIEAWVKDEVSEKAIISVNTDSQGINRQKHNASKIVTNEKLQLNAKSEINALKMLYYKNEKLQKIDDKAKIREILHRIENASNKESFYEPVLEALQSLGSCDTFRGCLYAISLYAASDWSKKQIDSILKITKTHFNEAYAGLRQDNYVVTEAIRFICKWDTEAENYFTKVKETRKYTFYHETMQNELKKRDSIPSEFHENGTNMDTKETADIKCYSI